MLAQLGGIAFEVVGPVLGLSGERRYGFAEHELLGEKPRLQVVGDALERLTLRLAFREMLGDPVEALRALHTAAAAKAALPFLLGTGELVGRYVIETVSHEAEETDDLGRLLAARVRVELLEWLADRPLPLAGADPEADARPDPAGVDGATPAVGDVRAVEEATPPPGIDFHAVSVGETTRVVEMEGTAGALRRVGRGVIQYVVVRTRDGERWDQLAARHLGSAFAYPELVAANPDLPATPTLPAGLELRVPVAGDAGADGTAGAAAALAAALLPPWKAGVA